jgi:RNA polymerase sigma-70 factor (ECF subfamily)
MSDTPVSLLERLRRRPDEASWQRLVALYTPLLRGWLRRHALHAQDAADLTQDVLVVVVRELPHFEHSGQLGAFRHWLRSILTNRLRDFWRAKRFRPVATGDSAFAGMLDQLQDPHSDLGRRWDEEHNEHVARHFLALIESEFQPTTWRAFQRVVLAGDKPAVVAQELGLSVNAVFIAKSRVLSRLREEMAGLTD